jgi:hypothetical protein
LISLWYVVTCFVSVRLRLYREVSVTTVQDALTVRSSEGWPGRLL